MGRGMATNLVKSRTRGHRLESHSRKDGGSARTAATPAEAARGVEVVWMCVSDTAAVENVLFGPDGVEQSLSEGMIVADSSTISPAATKSLPSVCVLAASNMLTLR